MKENLIIRENYLAKIRLFYESQYIKAITGIRRCGKSKILSQIIHEIINLKNDLTHIIYIDLEGKSGEGITTRIQLENKIEPYIKDEKNTIFLLMKFSI